MLTQRCVFFLYVSQCGTLDDMGGDYNLNADLIHSLKRYIRETVFSVSIQFVFTSQTINIRNGTENAFVTLQQTIDLYQSWNSNLLPGELVIFWKIEKKREYTRDKAVF